VCENYDDMSKKGADIIAALIKKKPDAILGLATGSTPLGLYSELAAKYAAGKINFSKVQTFNLDEYYRIKQADPQSYYYFMHENFFSKINIASKNIDIPFGDADDVLEECKRYHNKIAASKGIDIQLLGIGNNGHIGFNEPDDALSACTHNVLLTESTIEANSRYFKSADEVPKEALTMGIGEIMSARQILMLISGKSKAPVAKTLADNFVTTQIPASFIKLHPNVTVLIDKDAASEMKIK
jgi:glucosamine-6-phosphate deaminase